MVNFNELKNKAIYMNKDEYFDIFENCWNNMSDSFLKFECLQFYDEGEIYNDLKKGDSDITSNILNQFKVREEEPHLKALSNGIDMSRLHAVKIPLTEYIEIEYYFYYVNNILGEKIYYFDINEYEENLEDFVIFDKNTIFLLNYDDNGKLQGAWFLKDNDLIDDIIVWYNDRVHKAIPFQNMIKPNYDILKRIV